MDRSSEDFQAMLPYTTIYLDKVLEITIFYSIADHFNIAYS